MRIAFIAVILLVSSATTSTRAARQSAPDSTRVDPVFIGLTAATPAELAAHLRTRGALTGTGDSLRTRITTATLDYLTSRGRWFARIDSIRVTEASPGAARRATIHLAEGPAATIARLTLEGNAALPSSTLLAACDLTPGARVTAAALEADIARMLALYDRAGRPFSEIRVEDLAVRRENDEAPTDITLRIDEGEAVHIDEITIEGNTLTRTDVIVREIRIAEGEPWNADRVGEVRRRLERLGFFSRVQEPELYVRNGRGGLLLRVVEGGTNTFDGVIGYQPPRREGEAGEVTGLVNLAFRNLFGTGRRFDARWERATRAVSELQFRYLEPWIFSLPFSLEGAFAQRQQDSSFVRRTIDLRATWMAATGFHVSGVFQRTDVIPSIGAGANAPQAGATTSAGAELLLDARDNVYNPLAGYLVRNAWSFGSKRVDDAAVSRTASVQRIELDASLFVEVLPRAVLALILHGRELRGSLVDASDVYRIGGANTLRGYREEQFTGTRLAWSSIETRYSLGRRSFAFLFFDLGYIYQAARTEALPEFRTVKYGYGLGGRIETGLGILGVSYALGEGDSFSTGKIHFGLINEF